MLCAVIFPSTLKARQKTGKDIEEETNKQINKKHKKDHRYEIASIHENPKPKKEITERRYDK